jgi:hypothetical protein
LRSPVSGLNALLKPALGSLRGLFLFPQPGVIQVFLEIASTTKELAAIPDQPDGIKKTR